jgi:hypothetical protein
VIGLVLMVLAGYPQVMDAKGCATCHLGGSTGADPKALKVFDLSHQHWPREIEEGRLVKVKSRLQGKAATEAEISEVIRFILTDRAQAVEKQQQH